jgi:hypothetical protein
VQRKKVIGEIVNDDLPPACFSVLLSDEKQVCSGLSVKHYYAGMYGRLNNCT